MSGKYILRQNSFKTAFVIIPCAEKCSFTILLTFCQNMFIYETSV